MISAFGVDSLELRKSRLAELLRHRIARRRAFPMSFQQCGIWFIEQLRPGSAAYHVPLALDFAETRDPALLQSALDLVVARHSALRTTFGVDEITFTPVQIVHESLSAELTVVDLTDLSEFRAQRLAGEESRRHARTPFDLERGPLIRARLLRLPGGRQRLLITIHHLIADGWSLHLLIRDLDEAYAARCRGGRPDWEAKVRDYHDWAAWQRERDWQPHLDYYRRVLRDAPAGLRLPTDRPRPAVPTLAAGRHEWTVPAAPLRDLHARARAAGTTLYAVLLAALATVLHRRTGQDTVVIGTPMANRTHPVLQDVVGYFVNIGVIPVTLTADSPVRQVHRLMLGALSHQDLPFERLVDALAPARSLAVHPIFQVMLALQNTPDAWETERRLEATDAAKFDLTLNAVEAPDGLHLDCVYAAELFDPATVTGLCDEFTATLISGDPT